MDMNTPNPNPMQSPSSMPPTGGVDMSTHKVFGVPRRMIAFGFALFLMLVVLAFVYSQFASPEPQSAMPTNTSMMEESTTPEAKRGNMMPSVMSPVTPEVLVDDLISEAVSDSEDTNSYTDDEVADVEDGSNY